MKYCVKTEVFKEGVPFNKWFHYESNKQVSINELLKDLGIMEKSIGVVILNNNPVTTNKVLKDRDSIRFVGKIYPEYL